MSTLSRIITLGFVAQGINTNRPARHCFYLLFVYSFFECSGFSPELEKRGFDSSFDMPCYLFREDGKMIWEAYGKFAANFVNEIYHRRRSEGRRRPSEMGGRNNG
jgi:hypothetical protein